VHAQSSLTYPELVRRLIDLESLAVLPVAGDRCAQWSSWDRASQYDSQTGKYVHWDANGDGDGIIRKEGELSLMAEMQGPGCIWRIWSALPKKGTEDPRTRRPTDTPRTTSTARCR
jgi:hypothetical protein